MAETAGVGTVDTMTESTDDPRISHRADLLPEELTVGSADPTEQARLILEESDARTEHSDVGSDGSELDPEAHQ